jgi:hypothetical protein
VRVTLSAIFTSTPSFSSMIEAIPGCPLRHAQIRAVKPLCIMKFKMLEIPSEYRIFSIDVDTRGRVVEKISHSPEISSLGRLVEWKWRSHGFNIATKLCVHDQRLRMSGGNLKKIVQEHRCRMASELEILPVNDPQGY